MQLVDVSVSIMLHKTIKISFSTEKITEGKCANNRFVVYIVYMNMTCI